MDFYITICRSTADPNEYELATGQLFTTRKDACRYADGIESDREPKVISLGYAVASLRAHVSLA
jgi:hypothetical protein